MTIDIVVGLISVLVAIAIILYATWLLTQRLKAKEPKGKSFREWLKHLFEAIWGL